jgi:hypothetical protein
MTQAASWWGIGIPTGGRRPWRRGPAAAQHRRHVAAQRVIDAFGNSPHPQPPIPPPPPMWQTVDTQEVEQARRLVCAQVVSSLCARSSWWDMPPSCLLVRRLVMPMPTVGLLGGSPYPIPMRSLAARGDSGDPAGSSNGGRPDGLGGLVWPIALAHASPGWQNCNAERNAERLRWDCNMPQQRAAWRAANRWAPSMSAATPLLGHCKPFNSAMYVWPHMQSGP